VVVILFGPRPEYDNELPRLLADSILRGDAGFAQHHLYDRSRPLDAEMSRLARDTWHVPYISLMTLLCSESGCIEYVAPGLPIQSDYAHFTLQGSAYVGRAVNARFPGIFESR